MKPIYTIPEKIILFILIILLFCVSAVVIFSNASKTPLLFSKERNFFLININSASLEELRLIPYISRNIAQKIIKYRQEKGSIHDVNELLILKDIGPATLKRLKDYLKDTSH